MSQAPAAQRQPQTIAELIQKQTPGIAMVMNGRTPEERAKRAERFARIALTAVRLTPKLAECSMPSFAAALMTCAQLNLEPGPQGHAYLIPYKGECTFQLGYKGLLELVYRSGLMSSVYAEVVYRAEVERGKFKFAMGLERQLSHEIDLLDDCRDGELVAAYAVAEMKDGTRNFVVLSKKEIERAKASSSSARYGSGPWSTSPEEMWKKTALKRLCKWLPQSVEAARAIELDDTADRGEAQIFDVDALPVPQTPGEKLAGALDAKLETIDATASVNCPREDGASIDAAYCGKCTDRAGCPAYA